MHMPNTGSLKVEARGDREIVMTRVFDAPRNLVYEAFTKPDLVKRWLGVFGGWSLPVCEIDLRVGGRYRFVWRKPGTEMGMSGVYKEIVPNERIVNTEKFDDPWYEGEAIGTVTFVERGGKTTLTQTVLYSSKQTRDGVLKSPMESGVAQSYDKLAEILSTISSSKPAKAGAKS
jgi:uncharacterized protein YndB with AHSA1/START domain